MAILKPRNRILVLRLSQEEYEALRTRSLNRGARNLSAFARSALLAAIARTDDEGGPEWLGDVRRAISDLYDVVGHMAERIDQMVLQEVPLREARKA